MKRLTRAEWLSDIPEVIYKLKSEYGFYFSGMYTCITKDILEVLNPKKHNHKMVLYKRGERFFFVIYLKNGPQIYYTNDYVDSNWSRVRYFLKKFQRAYDRAEELDYGNKNGTDYKPDRVESTN